MAAPVYGTTGEAKRDADQYLYLGDHPDHREQGEFWSASRCLACQDATLWHGTNIIWPARELVGPAPAADLPTPVRELYEEGRRVAAVSRRAGAALLRAALEQLVKELVPGPGTLNVKIGKLQGDVSPRLGRALDVLRDAGNGVLHDGVPEGVAAMVIAEAAQESEVFDYLCGVVNRLAEEAITAPRVDDELYGKLPESVRKAAEQRNARAAGTP